MIFSRGRGSGRHARSGDAARSGRHADKGGPDEVERSAGPDPGDSAGGTARGGTRRRRRTGGPYDVSEAPAGVERIDLGSLQIPAVEGVEVRVQANPDGAIQQVVLVHAESALQLGVFAAPRSAGIWDEVRDEIRQSLAADGVSAQEAEGEYGTELRARVRGPEGVADLRFLGVDGPRWMVRGVYQGRAAVEPEAAGPLAECLAGLVVERGWEAMPAREPLPLRLPREIAESAHAQGAADGSPAPAGPPAPEGPNSGGAQAPGGQPPAANGRAPGTGGTGKGRPPSRPRRRPA